MAEPICHPLDEALVEPADQGLVLEREPVEGTGAELHRVPVDPGLEALVAEHPGKGVGYDEVVVRGNLDGDRVFTALWLLGDRIVAGMHANDWDAIDQIRRLVGTEASGATRDPSVPLADL